ncbi:hypothetical protein MAHJHV50_49660 [Mycobacterium avium subsp. hominissuis]
MLASTGATTVGATEWASPAEEPHTAWATAGMPVAQAVCGSSAGLAHSVAPTVVAAATAWGRGTASNPR